MKFPATYCLTCYQTDRPAKAKAHFEEAGVPARFLQSYHGRTWGLETRLCAHDDWKIDTGHVGLLLGHWMVWQIAWDRGVPEVLICEDDAIFCSDFLARYAQHRAELPADAQIWYCGSVGQCDHLRQATPNLRHLDHRGPHGTHAYWCRRDALPVLLDKCQEARVYIDQSINYNAMPHLIGYASCPSLVGQHSAEGSWPHAVGGNPAPTDPPALRDPFTDRIDAELKSLDHVPGWCCPEKRRAIYDAVHSMNAPTCVELGVFGGQSLLPAAMALRDNLGGKITGIDPYTAIANAEAQLPGEHTDWWQKNVDYRATELAARREIQERGLSQWCEILTCMPEDVAVDFPVIDYLHLDDSHATQVAVRNVQTWLPKLRAGGCLVLDDAAWESVQPARALIAAQCDLIGQDSSPGRRWEVWKKRQE